MDKISPFEVMKLLRENGIQVSEQQSAFVLDFMRKLADIIVAQHLAKGQKSGSAGTGSQHTDS